MIAVVFEQARKPAFEDTHLSWLFSGGVSWGADTLLWKNGGTLDVVLGGLPRLSPPGRHLQALRPISRYCLQSAMACYMIRLPARFH